MTVPLSVCGRLCVCTRQVRSCFPRRQMKPQASLPLANIFLMHPHICMPLYQNIYVHSLSMNTQTQSTKSGVNSQDMCRIIALTRFLSSLSSSTCFLTAAAPFSITHIIKYIPQPVLQSLVRGRGVPRGERQPKQTSQLKMCVCLPANTQNLSQLCDRQHIL